MGEWGTGRRRERGTVRGVKRRNTGFGAEARGENGEANGLRGGGNRVAGRGLTEKGKRRGEERRNAKGGTGQEETERGARERFRIKCNKKQKRQKKIPVPFLQGRSI